MVLLAVFQHAVDVIDPVIIKLWKINRSQEYIDWVANLSTHLPNSPLSSTPLFRPAFLLKMRSPIIECDLLSY